MLDTKVFNVSDNSVLEEHGATSGGNQVKYLVNNCFVKVDSRKESLAEVLTAILLSCIKNLNTKYVDYGLCKIVDGFWMTQGSYSVSLAVHGYNITNVYKLLKAEMSDDEIKNNFSSTDIEEKIAFVIEYIKGEIGFDATEYLHDILILDALTFNTDRHLSNLALLYRKGKIAGVILDNGCGFGCNRDGSSTAEYYEQFKQAVKAKPFSMSFDKQAECIMRLNSEMFAIDYKELYSKIKEFACNVNQESSLMYRDARNITKLLGLRLKETEGKLWYRI